MHQSISRLPTTPNSCDNNSESAWPHQSYRLDPNWDLMARPQSPAYKGGALHTVHPPATSIGTTPDGKSIDPSPSAEDCCSGGKSSGYVLMHSMLEEPCRPSSGCFHRQKLDGTSHRHRKLTCTGRWARHGCRTRLHAWYRSAVSWHGLDRRSLCCLCSGIHIPRFGSLQEAAACTKGEIH